MAGAISTCAALSAATSRPLAATREGRVLLLLKGWSRFGEVNSKYGVSAIAVQRTVLGLHNVTPTSVMDQTKGDNSYNCSLITLIG